MQRRFIAAALAAAFAIPCSTLAAEDEAAVVVTATRMPARASELLNDVTVLHRDDIEASGAATLPELLASQPGVQFTTNGGAGKTTSLLIRGAESRHTVVLVDGMRVNSATSGDTAVQHIPLSQIERIEIVRGPVSSLYGSEAIGGVVQIFTRRGEGPVSGNVQASAGSRNTSDVSAGLSGSGNVLNYALTAGHFQTDGVSALTNRANSSFHPDADGYRQDNVSGRLGVQVAPGHDLAANLFYSDSVSRYDAFGAGNYDARIYQTLQGVGVESRNRLGQWTSTLRIADSTDDMTGHASATSTTVFQTGQAQAVWQNDFHTPWGDVLAGIERLEQRIDSTTAYTTKERSVDSLLLGYQGRLDAHRLQISARRDDNSQFGARTTGMGYYGYQFTPALRASVGAGTSFSAPTFNQLYYPGFSNPNLKPEHGRSKEAALTWDNGHARSSVTWFDNRVRDLIQSVLVTPPFGYQVENVQNARLTGWTIAVEANRLGWRPRVAYDWLDARDEGNDLYLRRRAKEHLTLAVSKEFGDWLVNGEVVASGHRYEDAANTQKLAGYTVVNAGLDYRASADTTLFARAVNIFDKKYELAADYATTRAGVFVGVRQRIR
ncbi:MAG: TonB-dependent receptor [Rhodocyclales bacterium]|nr:TonB-dependent receptor [Rhodocyclales bacterium]